MSLLKNRNFSLTCIVRGTPPAVMRVQLVDGMHRNYGVFQVLFLIRHLLAVVSHFDVLLV